MKAHEARKMSDKVNAEHDKDEKVRIAKLIESEVPGIMAEIDVEVHRAAERGATRTRISVCHCELAVIAAVEDAVKELGFLVGTRSDWMNITW